MEFTKTKLTTADKYALSHLMPATEFCDNYLCYITKNNKNIFMYSVLEKIEEWVTKNGGRFKIVSNDKTYIGDRKGFIVNIVFPSYNKRNMKEIMSNLFYKKETRI